MKILPVDPGRRDVQALIAEADAQMVALYPPQSNHLDDIGELSRPGVYFVGAFVNQRLAGIGALKRLENDGVYGEIKRVYVSPQFRGRGIAAAIMVVLEAHALSQGIGIVRLETGSLQAGALGLYRKLGYRERPAYGDYAEDPLSVFMQKRLSWE